jgi:hypothetical protein
MWSEMEGEKKGLVPLMKGVTPREAAHIFNLGKNGVGGFEVGADDDKRQGYADDIYKEYTGKTVAPTQSLGSSGTDSGSSGGSGTTDCPSSGAATDGAIPSEECQAVLKEYDELVASGKITTQDKWHTDNIDKDVKNCTTEQIECGTGDGKGGVHPRILRAVTAAAKNSGANTLTTWNFNTGHDCDGLNHPRGMAVDIYCIGNKGTAKGGSTRTATEDCNLLFKYFYDHYEELGLTELIWTYPPPEFSCSDPKIMCYVAGHTDHIHVGTRVQ